MDIKLRLNSLNEFIGNKQTAETLGIEISVARKQNRLLGHTIFGGNYGCGKTTLANICHLEMKSPLFLEVNGAALSKKKQIAKIIFSIKKGCVLFLDEIHAIPLDLCEMLYPVLEDFKFPYMTDGGIMTYNVPEFTWIGATTDSGALSGPMLSRFSSHYYL